MRNLTIPEINAIKDQFPGCKAIAVENFLMSCGNNPTITDAIGNLQMDARSYKWNDQTINAIRLGITRANRSTPNPRDAVALEYGYDSANDFMTYLAETLIPSLQDSGSRATAKDFLCALQMLRV